MMHFGTPSGTGAIRALLLGSGELGKELVIELQRFGVEVIACDRYAMAPAMQVAHRSLVFDMQDGEKLREVIRQEKPSLIIPEIEAIATHALLDLEMEGFRVVPTARAVHLTMDREGIRRLAHEVLDLPTARYEFAASLEELNQVAERIGFPCVIKPLMSSSGKGQSLVRSASEVQGAFIAAREGSRGASQGKVIVEEFVPFESEITLLTIRAVNGTHFFPPIGHRQEGGDYVESWLPHSLDESQFAQAQAIAQRITDELGGFGLFGVELFLLRDGRVLFSEVSPRPHDTGMVSLASQGESEFSLHAKAILGLPVYPPRVMQPSASVALRASRAITRPVFQGVAHALEGDGVNIRLFGKPAAHPGRRMGVLLATGASVAEARQRANAALDKISMAEENEIEPTRQFPET